MAPKVPEKQHNQQQHHQQQPLHNNSIVIKHSNLFHISALTLCHNKRLKLKRSKYGEYLRNAYQIKPTTANKIKRSATQQNSHKTEVRRRKLNSLMPDVTIDLLSDDEEQKTEKINIDKPTVIVHPERMSLERAAILGLMPVEMLSKPPPLAPILTNHHHPSPKQMKKISTKQKQQPLQQPVLIMPAPKQLQKPRKRKSKPQKRRSLPDPPRKPIMLDPELIILSDDSNDVPIVMPAPQLSQSFSSILPPNELSVTYSTTSSEIPCLPQQNTIQVDEEVTISLVPRSLNATNCGSRSSRNSSNSIIGHESVFPMLPDETTVHTVIANRIYELSLSKLREGLASCGIPEFADDQQKVSPQRRKGNMQQPPLVSPPQAPISLKLSSDLSISLISDDEDDVRLNNYRHEPILSPAFLQKLPVNVSIAPVPMVTPNSNHANEPRKLKLG